ncbi:holin [Streptomyces sp. NPDC054804]
MVTSTRTPKLLADIAERAVLTYVEAFLGLLLASGTTNVVNLSTLESAAIAAIPAGLAVAKGAVGSLLGRAGTASWLPADSDPASTTIN